MSESFDLSRFLKQLPKAPGVYHMLDNQGKVIYVGKAKNLKNRVSSYFNQTTKDVKTQALVAKIERIDVTVVHSETDALILENEAIKRYRPKYNVLLRDDKSYPYIMISAHRHPRLAYHRRATQPKGQYFGPYPNGSAVRESLNLLQKLFPIRQCEDTFYKARTRPCLQYQIKRCLAPCVAGFVSDEVYAAQVKLVALFLKGKNQQVISELVTQMETAAKAQAYEQAARIRDQIKALTTVVEQQEVSRLGGEMDVIGLAYEHGLACVYMMFIRQGKILGHRHYYPKIPLHTDMVEVLRGFVVQFYLHEQRQNLPKEVLLATEFADLTVLQETMNQKLDHSFVFKTVVRGDRANFIRLANTNAMHALQAKLEQNNTVAYRLQALEAALELSQPIQRLECFDISHMQGEATMASCVVFTETGPVNRDYRRYRIQDIQGGDDYAAMRQALTKRYQDPTHVPDVLLIDGGIGQLKVAESVLAEAIPEVEKRPLIIGVAKGEGRKAGLEKLILANSHETVRLPADDPGLHLVQWIRDESHRYAITGHRQARQRKRTTSTLESIPGVGPKRRQKLLQYLGGIQEVRQASVTQLKKVPGISDELAQIIFDALQR